ncbi:hypothetical protein EDD94_2718 [Streptomyces sp. PanSC9]|nr:hypothetical protein EDD94_2718 [Streptomyces sp. PanSC9]
MTAGAAPGGSHGRLAGRCWWRYSSASSTTERRYQERQAATSAARRAGGHRRPPAWKTGTCEPGSPGYPGGKGV